MANVIWMTGFSGAGKSTLAKEIQKRISPLVILDGDVIRSGLCKDLGFSIKDRTTNIERIAYVAKAIVDNGVDVIVPAITPTDEARDLAMNIVGKDNFILIWVRCSLKICEDRDVKGLYKKARNGEIKNFTGIDSPFDDPKRSANISVFTDLANVRVCADKIINYLNGRAGIRS